MARPTGCPPVAWQRKAGSYFSALVGSRNGAMLLRFDLSVALRFL